METCPCAPGRIRVLARLGDFNLTLRPCHYVCASRFVCSICWSASVSLSVHIPPCRTVFLCLLHLHLYLSACARVCVPLCPGASVTQSPMMCPGLCVSWSNPGSLSVAIAALSSVRSPRGRPCPAAAALGSCPRCTRTELNWRRESVGPDWAKVARQVPAFWRGPAPCPPKAGYKFSVSLSLGSACLQWSHLEVLPPVRGATATT